MKLRGSGTKSKKYILNNPLYDTNKDFQFFLMSASSSWEIWTLALVKTKVHGRC